MMQPYKKAFLDGYAKDHKPEERRAQDDLCHFAPRLVDMDDQEFAEAKAEQKHKFRYRKPSAGDDEQAAAEGAGGALAPSAGIARAARTSALTPRRLPSSPSCACAPPSFLSSCGSTA